MSQGKWPKLHMGDRRPPSRFAPQVVAAIRTAALRYYRAHARTLPWRGERDPYRIWISEVMLQQTQVVTVIDRYQHFLREFPNVRALAAASIERVSEAWAGLGYYCRARNLKAAAEAVMSRHGGALPRSAAELQTLPGIGRYTAGAVASIAYGEEAPVVDGNVARLLARMLALESSPVSAEGAKQLWAAAGRLVVGPTPGDLNQALMELGALLCRPTAPACDICPLSRWCRAYAEGCPERYPRRLSRRRERPRLDVTLAWLEDRAGVWLERRPGGGLWAGQWQLPSEDGRNGRARLAARLALSFSDKLGTVDHELTHRRVRATVLAATSRQRLRVRRDFRRFVRPDTVPASALTRRAIALVLDARKAR